jgi:hypothetical protein
MIKRNFDYLIGKRIKAHGQEAYVTQVVHHRDYAAIHLDISIVVPTWEYTRDWVHFSEIQEIFNN